MVGAARGGKGVALVAVGASVGRTEVNFLSLFMLGGGR